MFVDNVIIDVGFIYDRGFENGVLNSCIRHFSEFQIDDEFRKDLYTYYRMHNDEFDYMGFDIDFEYKGHKFNFSFSSYINNLDVLIYFLNEFLFDLKNNRCKWLLLSLAFIDDEYYDELELFKKMDEIYKL